MADLRGKVAVVTGASGGVGKGIAEGLAEAGATVYVTGRSESFTDPPASWTIQATARAVHGLGGQGIPVRVDHANDHEVEALFARVHGEQGRLDVLVNHVCGGSGTLPGGRRFWEQPISVWDDQCGIVLRSYYVAAAFAAPLMVGQRSGLIVNVSPVAGGQYLFSAAHGVCKSGVDRMAKDMAIELEGYQVAVLSLWRDAATTERLLDAANAEAVGLDSTAAQPPRFTGRCIAALAMDPDVIMKSGGIYGIAALAAEYRFVDPDKED